MFQRYKIYDIQNGNYFLKNRLSIFDPALAKTRKNE